MLTVSQRRAMLVSLRVFFLLVHEYGFNTPVWNVNASRAFEVVSNGKG